MIPWTFWRRIFRTGIDEWRRGCWWRKGWLWKTNNMAFMARGAYLSGFGVWEVGCIGFLGAWTWLIPSYFLSALPFLPLSSKEESRETASSHSFTTVFSVYSSLAHYSYSFSFLFVGDTKEAAGRTRPGGIHPT